MLVLIDESGCSGFKLGKGSTAYFIVSMVIFENFEEAEKASTAIQNLREKLNIKPEFKFSKSHNDIRDKFFTTAKSFNFSLRTLVVDKSKIYSPKLRTEKETFYNFFVKSLLKYDDNLLQNARIKIDGSGDREFKRSLNSYLRKELGKGKIKSLKFTDSKKDNLIQLADMCAGAIMRSYKTETRSDPNRWKNMLQEKIDDIWEFK